jgi:hypothetical protein
MCRGKEEGTAEETGRFNGKMLPCGEQVLYR